MSIVDLTGSAARVDVDLNQPSWSSWLMIASLICLVVAGGHSPVVENAFNGTWIMEVALSSKSPRLELISLKNSIFSRGTNIMDLSVPADGAFHSLPSTDYFDAVAIEEISPSHIRETDRLKELIVYIVDYSVSQDQNTMVQELIDLSKPDRKPVPTRIRYQRTGQAEPHGSILNGQWKEVAIETTPAHLTENIFISGDRISHLRAGGYGYEAKIGGLPVPIKGDADTARVAVTMPDGHSIVEHMSLHGVATVKTEMTLIDDGQSIRVTGQRLTDGTLFSWVLHKK